MAIFEQNYIVGVTHVDPSATISNMGMLSILEDIACKHSDIAGFGFMDIPVKHLSWVLLAWKVKILKRVSYGATLKVTTWAKAANKFQTCRDFEVFDENGDVVCIATSKWTLIDTQKETITRITDEIIAPYSPEQKNIFENAEIDKLLEPENHSCIYTYVTQRRDIDVNNHMHNLNYLAVAYEALPTNIYSEKSFNNIEIMYKKSIRLGNTVKCFYTVSDNIHYVTIKSEDEKSLHAIIKLS